MIVMVTTISRYPPRLVPQRQRVALLSWGKELAACCRYFARLSLIHAPTASDLANWDKATMNLPEQVFELRVSSEPNISAYRSLGSRE